MTSTGFKELTLITKIETLTDQVYPRLRNWPKHERYALSQDIRNGLTELIKLICLANKVVSRRVYYAQEADGVLLSIIVNFRTAYRQRYINKGFHENISSSLTEISRLLTAYIRSGRKVRNKKLYTDVTIDNK